jgi:heme-degrading monooxygenase HmoA
MQLANSLMMHVDPSAPGMNRAVIPAIEIPAVNIEAIRTLRFVNKEQHHLQGACKCFTMNKITRIWHGRTRAEHADVYLRYIEETGMDAYKSTPGNLSAKVLRSIQGNICHFLTVTEWDSIGSIKTFAGEQYEQARYYSEDKRYLLELEEYVMHYETFEY